MTLKDIFIKSHLKPEGSIPEFKSGDTVHVTSKFHEGDVERLQHFEGVVIGRQGKDIDETFTVRKISFGVGVERTFPLHSPDIKEIKVLKKGTLLSFFAVSPPFSRPVVLEHRSNLRFYLYPARFVNKFYAQTVEIFTLLHSIIDKHHDLWFISKIGTPFHNPI